MHREESENQAAAHEVGGDHQPAAVHPIHRDAGHRADDRDGKKLHDHHPGDGGGRAGEVKEESVDRDRVEPVAEL